MRHVVPVLACAVLLAGCGGGSTASSGSPTSPSGVSANASTSVASLAGKWLGRDEGRSTITWTLTQDGGTVSGTSSFVEPGSGGGGTVTGTVSGSTFTFTDTYPTLLGANQTCSATLHGQLTINGAGMSGPYTGTNSCTGAFEGQVSFTKQ